MLSNAPENGLKTQINDAMTPTLTLEEQEVLDEIVVNQTKWTKANTVSVVSAVALFIVAAVSISIFLERFHPDEIIALLRSLSHAQIGTAIGLTVASFFVLAGYDLLALAHIGRKVNPWRVAFIATCAGGVSNAVGLAVLSGGSVRLRMYNGLGIRPADIARIAVFVGLSFGLGTTAVAAVALAIEPEAIARRFGGSTHFYNFLSAWSLLWIIIGYFACYRRRPFKFFKWTIRLPLPNLYLGQILVAVLDLALVAAIYYVLLPPDTFTGNYGDVIVWYCIALTAAYLSHVPGGLGVFDGIIVLGLHGLAPDAVLTATVIAFRVVYYLGPLGFALLGIVGNEAWHSRGVIGRILNGKPATG